MPEYVCIFCDAHNIHDSMCFPDYNYCKGCKKHQQTGELNWKLSTAKMKFENDSFSKRRF